MILVMERGIRQKIFSEFTGIEFRTGFVACTIIIILTEKFTIFSTYYYGISSAGSQ